MSIPIAEDKYRRLFEVFENRALSKFEEQGLEVELHRGPDGTLFRCTLLDEEEVASFTLRKAKAGKVAPGEVKLGSEAWNATFYFDPDKLGPSGDLMEAWAEQLLDELD